MRFSFLHSSGDRLLPSILFLLISAMLVSGTARGQVSSKNANASTPEELGVAFAVHVDHAPKVDGTLNDQLWQSAKPIINFRQREPLEGQAPSEKTEVRTVYTRHAIYFGIHCYDSKPSGIIATELRRDVLQDLDDHFEILIDSNHNRRGAYVFQINPLGTQVDGLIVEERPATDGGDFDRGWDGVWTSAARITTDGWTATVEIPFSTLNFTQSQQVNWGLNFKRFIRRKNEDDLWMAYRRTFGLAKVSEAGELRGIQDIGSGRLFIVKPYGLAQYDKQTAQAPKFPLTGGVDVKYGLSSNLVLNLTGNTDFADTEVDLQPFNLTPFKVFIPEKRQFFLENAGVFNFDLGDQDQLFFSRQIGVDPVTGNQVPINGGAKLTGTLGRLELGILDVDTRSSGPNPYANFAIVRLKESLWAGSYIGVMGADKRSGNVLDNLNQTGGVDTRLVFFKDWFVDAHAAGTRSPTALSGASDIGASLSYRSNWLDGIVERRKIGPNFNPEVGFIQRTDSNETYGDLILKIRPKNTGVRELQLKDLFSMRRTPAGRFPRKNGRTRFALTLTTAPIRMTTSLMCSRSELQRHSTSIKMCSSPTVYTTSPVTNLHMVLGKIANLPTASTSASAATTEEA